MKLVTHNGKFHTDEVFGAAMIKFLIPTIEIVRTRDNELINDAIEDLNSIVIDVGKIYNPNKDAYDHHQESFRYNYYGIRNGINMSSCGLVWKHFALEIIDRLILKCFSKKRIEDNQEEIIVSTPSVNRDKVCRRFYDEVVMHVDANDNGVKHIKNSKYVQYNYRNLVTLENVIGSYNGKNVNDDNEQMIRFKKAMKVCEEFLCNKLHSIIQNQINYDMYLDEFLDEFSITGNNEWIYIKNSNMNYSLYLNNFDPGKNIKFIIIKKKNEFRIHTRRIKNGDFDIVAKIIKEENAKNLVGDDEVVFVHINQFVGACKSLESAVAICEESLRKYWGWMLPVKQFMEYIGF